MRTLLAAALIFALPTLAAADPVERRLHADVVTASSFLWNDWNRFQENYHPLYVSDDDPRTAWTEGSPGSGAGEWLRLTVSKMDGATRARLRLRAGYQKSSALFKANARPKEVTFKLLPSGVEKHATLADAEGWQEVVIEQPAGPLDTIELRFGTVYEGKKYTDLCISDIQVFVAAETKENPAFEKSKLDKVLAWKASRLEAARTFQQAAAKEIPLLPGYKYVASKEDIDWSKLWEHCSHDPMCWTAQAVEAAAADPVIGKHEAALALVKQALADGNPGFVVGQVAPVDKRAVPQVDGLEVPNLYQAIEMDYLNDALDLPLVGALGALRADQLGTFGTTEKTTLEAVVKSKGERCSSKRPEVYSWLHREPAPGEEAREQLRAAVFVQCARVEVRDGAARAVGLQVVVYGADGKLELTAGPGYVDTFTWADSEGHPAIVGGRAAYVGGRHADLTRPEIAKAP
jgi:hypothetical protein